jgi:hypothetical protein
MAANQSLSQVKSLGGRRLWEFSATSKHDNDKRQRQTTTRTAPTNEYQRQGTTRTKNNDTATASRERRRTSFQPADFEVDDCRNQQQTRTPGNDLNEC